MQWNDETIKQMRTLASEGYTRAEAAAELDVSYNALKAKARRLKIEFAAPEQAEYDSDGTQSSETVLRVVKGHEMTPSEVLEAHGYDPKRWKLVGATSNFWKQTPTATLYQSKIRIAPDADMGLDELVACLNADIEPVHITREHSGERSLVIPLYDMHFGITTYDGLQLRLEELMDVIRHGYKHIVIELGGDLLHSDFMNSTHTVSGTQLDHVDMVKAWQDAKDFVCAVIEQSLVYADHVALYAIGGNHDFDMQWAFTDGLGDRYPQVDVHNTTEYRQAFRLGRVGIMMAHGDTALKKLPMLFATEYSDIWSNSTWREVHYGHFHHEIVSDDSGVITRQMGTPKKSDNYEKKNGYTMSSKAWKVYEYDDNRLRVTYDI